MLRSKLSVSILAERLGKLDLSDLRRLLSSITRGYASQFLAIQAANKQNQNKIAAQAIISLGMDMQRQLSIEDNNLDLQLQLEDVLISLKQIIVRSR